MFHNLVDSPRSGFTIALCVLGLIIAGALTVLVSMSRPGRAPDGFAAASAVAVALLIVLMIPIMIFQSNEARQQEMR